MPLPPAQSEGRGGDVGGVPFDLEQENELLLLEYERALEDVMSLLDDAASNKAQNDSGEMRTMEPFVRAQIQELQLRLRVNILFRKQTLYELRKRNSCNANPAVPPTTPEAKQDA